MFSSTLTMADYLMTDGVSLATLWKITRRDGEVFYFTDHDQDIDLTSASVTFGTPASSDVYVSALGYTRSAMKQSTSMEPDILEILGAVDDLGFKAKDLAAGLFDHALVEIGLVNWRDLYMGVIYLRRSYFGEVTIQAENYVVSIRSLVDILSREIVKTYQPTCPVDLGSVECTIDIDTDFTQDGYSIRQVGTVSAVSSVDERLTFEVTFSTFPQAPATYLDDGLLVWDGLITPTTNQNSGRYLEIDSYETTGADSITLLFPTPRPIVVGDTFIAYIGCSKVPTPCRTRFGSASGGRGNIRNYRGFPHIKPGYIPYNRHLRGMGWRS
jgi:uncharacterized phage protein (TIGR02218 family)